ncbi:hypothetical protein BS78_07G006000 [Paspalum vaginatum]|nr:hypothetical protein BS78_07G006000 [Paspalum vaginatum]
MAAQQHELRERDTTMQHGTARTKVAGDDEMLRTGFHNGTPLEAGKIADSQPVDLFAPAIRIAHHQADDDNASQSQQQPQEEDDGTHRYPSAAADHHPAPPQQGRQGMAEHAAGGCRLGRQA